MAGKDKTSWSFTGAMLDYFGRLPGTTAMDFQKELKVLTGTDRLAFCQWLNGIDYAVDCSAYTTIATT